MVNQGFIDTMYRRQFMIVYVYIYIQIISVCWIVHRKPTHYHIDQRASVNSYAPGLYDNEWIFDGRDSYNVSPPSDVHVGFDSPQ